MEFGALRTIARGKADPNPSVPGLSGQRYVLVPSQGFTQADAFTTRRFGGTSLGLAVSRRFCQLMGGGVTVASKPGQGSTFTAMLPAVVVEASS